MGEIFSFSVKMIFKNKVRSFLTMLGIIVGILSLILISVLGDAFSRTFKSVTDVLFKNDQLIISIQPTDDNKSVTVDQDGYIVIPEEISMDMRDVNRILDKEIDGDSYLSVGGILKDVALGTNEGRKTKFMMFGSCAEELSNSTLQLLKGRDITRADELNYASTALISNVAADYLFAGKDPIGETVVVEYRSAYIPVIIVGEYEHIGLVNYDNPSETVSLFFVNHTYLEENFSEVLGDSYWKRQEIVVSIKGVEDKELLKEQLQDQLNKLLNQKKWTIELHMRSEYVNSINEMVSIILRIIFVIACLSLFIGGVGIMNVMLITVTERTNEIGVRKALGATDGIIMFQFLCESFMLSLAGTVLGIALGMGVSAIIAEVGSGLLQLFLSIPVDIKVTLPFGMLLFSIISSILIGVVFGLYPAWKAVKMQVVDALRYE